MYCVKNSSRGRALLRRTLAVLLVLCLCGSLLPVFAFADDYEGDTITASHGDVIEIYGDADVAGSIYSVDNSVVAIYGEADVAGSIEADESANIYIYDDVNVDGNILSEEGAFIGIVGDTDVSGYIDISDGAAVDILSDTTVGCQITVDSESRLMTGLALDEDGNVTGNITYTGENADSYFADAAVIVWIDSDSTPSGYILISGTVTAEPAGASALNVTIPVDMDAGSFADALPWIEVYSLETADGQNLLSVTTASDGPMLSAVLDVGSGSNQTVTSGELVEALAERIAYIVYADDGILVDGHAGSSYYGSYYPAWEGQVLTVTGNNLTGITAGKYATVKDLGNGTFEVTVVRGGDLYIRAVTASGDTVYYRFGHDEDESSLIWFLVGRKDGTITLRSAHSFESEQAVKDSFTEAEQACIQSITLDENGIATVVVTRDMITISGSTISAK